MRDQLDYVTSDLTPERNHRTLELYALLVVALGLPVLDPDGSRAARAWDGAPGQPAHRRVERRCAPRAVDALPPDRPPLVRRGAGERDPLRRDGARRRTTTGCARPAGSRCTCTAPTARSRRSPTATPAATWTCCGWPAGRLGAPDLLYVATQGREGTAPAQRCVDFPVGGYYVQRSGWGDEPGGAFADERFLMFGCGPLGDGGHGHYDSLGVEAYGYGSPARRRPRPLHLRRGHARTGGTGSRAPPPTTP